ncbi:8-amino-7-oxononanoate synthase [Verrucomicrobiota bacterium]
MNREKWINDDLAKLCSEHLDRHLQAYPACGGKILIDGRTYLNFSSNDYLGLARHPEVISAAREAASLYGAGSSASRLMTGTLPCHEELEERISRLKGYPCALIFGSGFLANIGAIETLAGRNDHVFADKLIHSSLMHGIVMSRARLYRFKHNDPESLLTLLKKAPDNGRRLVITESVFSMDGDIAPLLEIAQIATDHNAMLMIDEAHATGIFGPAGSGLAKKLGIERSVTVSMSTLSKTLGSYGGVLTCREPLKDLLISRAHSFIYSTALPPSAAAAGSAALKLIEKNPDMGAKLLKRSEFFRDELSKAGLNTGNSQSQIIPVIVGTSKKALLLSEKLREEGILSVAIRPPTVPKGSARLRFSITLDHSMEDLKSASEIIVRETAAEQRT